MASQHCTQRLEDLAKLIHHHGTTMLCFCVSNLTFSLVATLENLIILRALWKASSIPANLKTFFLSLTFSDLAVGCLGQPMFGVIIAVMLSKAATGNYNFDLFCPTILNVCYFQLFLLVSASFLNLIAISVERLLAISLHLRYQDLVTPTRVTAALVSLWLTSCAMASVLISLPNQNNVVIASCEFVGILVATVAYIQINKVVRYHRKQIQCDFQNSQRVQTVREKKSAFNVLFMYFVFIGCYLPNLCTVMLLMTSGYRVSYSVARHVSEFLFLLNSSLNPLLYCWRYCEIREIVKSTMKGIFRLTNTKA